MDNSKVHPLDKDVDSLSVSTALSTGSRSRRGKYYAVRTGFKPGIYHTYADCLDQIRGFKNPMFKSFTDITEAEAFLIAPLTSAGGETDIGVTKFYAVRKGRVPGVYTDWPSAQQQIIGWTKPRHKAFYTRDEAAEFVSAEIEPVDSNSTAGSTSAIGAGKKGESVAAVELGPVPTKRKVSGGTEMTSLSGSGTKSKSRISAASTIIAAPSIPPESPGSAPLPPDAEDGFDNRIVMDPDTGKVKYKTAEAMTQTKLAPTGVVKSGVIDIYTDGSSRGNGKIGCVAGVGVYFGMNDSRNLSERLPGPRQTNQRAELQAILRALDISPIHLHVRIYSDSQYSINCVTEWYKKWQLNEWTKPGSKPIENLDLIKGIRERIEEREEAGARTGFFWVKGHAGVPGNVAADKLAVQGSSKAPTSKKNSTTSTPATPSTPITPGTDRTIKRGRKNSYADHDTHMAKKRRKSRPSSDES